MENFPLAFVWVPDAEPLALILTAGSGTFDWSSTVPVTVIFCAATQNQQN